MALSSLPALPSSARTRPLRACSCGCGGTTQRTFCPGHDSQLKAAIIRVQRGAMTLAEIEQHAGKGCRKAVEAGLKDAALLKRWNIATVPVKAAKATRKPKVEAETVEDAIAEVLENVG